MIDELLASEIIIGFILAVPLFFISLRLEWRLLPALKRRFLTVEYKGQTYSRWRTLNDIIRIQRHWKRPYPKPEGPLVQVGGFAPPYLGPGITISKEMEKCGVCRGSGRNPLLSMPKHLIPIDLQDVSTNEVCPACGGKGQVPTKGNIFWMTITPPDPNVSQAHNCIFSHQSICPFRFKRPHMSCSTCRMRRVLRGEMPNRIRVIFYIAAIWVDRPQTYLKMLLLKKFLTCAEWLMS